MKSRAFYIGQEVLVAYNNRKNTIWYGQIYEIKGNQIKVTGGDPKRAWVVPTNYSIIPL